MWANAVESLVPTNLTGLCYTGGGSHNGDYFQGLAGFKALTTLHLRDHFSSVLGLEVLSSLKTLCLRGTSDVLDDDAFSLLSVLINLTYLDLTHCKKVSSTHGFAPLACFTALTSLNLDGTLANDDVLLRTVSTLSALTRLAIKFVEHRHYKLECGREIRKHPSKPPRFYAKTKCKELVVNVDFVII
jgi:hypothetical protein